MDRRGFFRAGAAAGVAAAGGGCAMVEGLASGALAPDALAGFLSTFDRGVAKIDQSDLLGPLMGRLHQGSDPPGRPPGRGAEALARTSVRSLYVAGMVKDLPPEDWRHPEVRRRVVENLPLMDEAVAGTSAMLAALSPAQHRGIQARLRQHPGLGVQIAHHVDGPAWQVGLPLPVRLKTRAMLTHAAWRMRVQSPELLVDPVLDRVQRLATRSGPAQQLQRRLATRIGEDAFWEHQERLARARARGSALVAMVPDEAPDPRSATEPGEDRSDSEQQHRQRRKRELQEWVAQDSASNELVNKERAKRAKRKERGMKFQRIGGWLAGSGAVVLGIGGILMATTGIPGAFVMTAGGILLLVGIIILIVGTVKVGRA